MFASLNFIKFDKLLLVNVFKLNFNKKTRQKEFQLQQLKFQFDFYFVNRKLPL